MEYLQISIKVILYSLPLLIFIDKDRVLFSLLGLLVLMAPIFLDVYKVLEKGNEWQLMLTQFCLWSFCIAVACRVPKKPKS